MSEEQRDLAVEFMRLRTNQLRLYKLSAEELDKLPEVNEE